MLLLFISRLLLFLAVGTAAGLHPAIAVSFDFRSAAAWFFVFPAMSALAYFLKPPVVMERTALIAAGSALLVLFLFFGTDRAGLIFLAAAAASYVLTRLIFSGSARGSALASLETFFLGLLYYRLLNFARASEEAAQASQAIQGLLLGLAVAGFLFHTVVIYLAAFPDTSKGRRRREGLLLLAVATPLVLALSIFMPADFLQHEAVLNRLIERPRARSISPTNSSQDRGGLGENRGGGGGMKFGGDGRPLGGRKYPHSQAKGSKSEKKSSGGKDIREIRPDEKKSGTKKSGNGGDKAAKKQGKEKSNSKGDSDQQKGKSQQKQKSQRKREKKSQEGGRSKKKSKNQNDSGRVEQWDPNQESRGEGHGKQMAVMIIASKTEPVYAAEVYWGDLHPVQGLRISAREPLNRLARARFMETWKNPSVNTDEKRVVKEVFFMSALPLRLMPFEPERAEPTKLQARYHPFNYSYRVFSRFSVSGPEDWQLIKGLSEKEKQSFAYYLKTNISPVHRKIFARRLRHILKKNRSTGPQATGRYFATIEAILKSMSDYQYKLGYDEDTRISRLSSFIHRGKTGDCTEFSHTSAILARMAGIPARVATGYLAARSLQTAAHRRGLRILRDQIEPLKKIPMDELYLVTTSHRHAWVQFYMPGYGWVDFETTSHAKPPKKSENPNMRDVVIPQIEKEKAEQTMSGRRKLPWKIIGLTLAGLALMFLIGLYAYRHGRELRLALLSRGRSLRALEAGYRLLLMRLATLGYPVKGLGETAGEYAGRIPVFASAASIYTELRYRIRFASGEKDSLQKEFRRASKRAERDAVGGGFGKFWRKLLSLRSLRY